MDGPTRSEPRSASPSLEPVRLRRPDGRLQVGLGPWAWLVQGWSPGWGEGGREGESGCEGEGERAGEGEGLASGLVRALAGSTPGSADGGAPLPAYRVIGHGPLARQVRAHLASAGAGESDDGVVVLVCGYAVPIGTARRADLAGTPVLPVVAQTHRVVVGPWVGLVGGPCLHCLDLHRTDADPGWPSLVAALDDPTIGPPPRPAEDVIGLVTALTGLLVSRLRRDGRDERGLAYEVGVQHPHLVLRRWPVHPACPWHRG